MGLHWLPATALKTPVSVYLTLVPCANSRSLTSYGSIAVIVDEFPRLLILLKLMGSTIRSTSLLALLRQTKLSPVQASLGPKSMTALSNVCPCDLCMVMAQQSRSGSCVLTCVPPSCKVVSTGEIGTQPLYLAASDTGYTYITARLVAYRFLGYVLVLLRRRTRIYVQQ